MLITCFNVHAITVQIEEGSFIDGSGRYRCSLAGLPEVLTWPLDKSSVCLAESLFFPLRITLVHSFQGEPHYISITHRNSLLFTKPPFRGAFKKFNTAVRNVWIAR